MTDPPLYRPICIPFFIDLTEFVRFAIMSNDMTSQRGYFMLISTLPKTDAQKAVLARAKQLTDIRWTPIADVPMYLKKEDVYTVFPKGVEVVGLPYSSVERTDKFIPENVSFETFLSAVANPHSKLYTAGHGKVCRANFGIVCNSFVRYALGIRNRFNKRSFATFNGT